MSPTRSANGRSSIYRDARGTWHGWVTMGRDENRRAVRRHVRRRTKAAVTDRVQLPDATAEGLFMGEVAMPFVAYLNWAFAHGGFPDRTAGGEQWRIKQGLAQDLLPL